MPQSFDDWETMEKEDRGFPEAAKVLRKEAQEMEEQANRLKSPNAINYNGNEWAEFYREEASAYRRAASFLENRTCDGQSA